MVHRCEKCGKSFSRKDNLKRHLSNPNCCQNNVPTRHVSQNECEKCGKSFSRKEYLNRHLSTTNCSQCSVCGKDSFPSPQTLKEHRKTCKTHATRCPNCNKTLKDVKSHLRRTGCSERRKCDICSETFLHMEELNRHVLQKHKQYECDHCNTKHRSARSLFHHKNRFHRDNPEKDSDESIIEDEVSNNSDVQPADVPGPSWVGDHDKCSCWYCGERFANQTLLRDHNYTNHQLTNVNREVIAAAKPRPHKCPYEGCTKSFMRRSTLLVHIGRRHESIQKDEANSDMDVDTSDTDSEDDINDEDNDDFLPSASKLFKTIGEPTKRMYKKFNTEELEITYTLKRKAIELSAMGYSYEVIQKVFKEIFREYTDRDGYLQVFLDSWTLDFPINTRAERASDQYLNSLMHQIESVLSSKDTFLFDAPVTIKLTFVPSNQLSVGVRLKFSQCPNNDEFSHRSRFCWCPVSLDSNDFRCLGACLVAFFRIRTAVLAKENYKKNRWYRDKGATIEFQREVDKIYAEVGVENDRFQNEVALDKFQTWLNNKSRNDRFQIVVYGSPSVKNVVYSGTPSRGYKQKIYLSAWHHHCYLILDIQGYLKKEVCIECGNFYSMGKIHTCPKQCSEIVKNTSVS